MSKQTAPPNSSNPVNKVWHSLIAFFSSMRLAVVVLMLLFIITWLGTLYQVDNGLFAAQKKYFSSWWIPVNLFGAELPLLPGGYLLQALLFVNLVIGGLVRMRWDMRRAGILLTHMGIALLLVSGFVKAELSNEGGLALYEGEQSDQYYDHFHWELVVGERLGNGIIREYRWDEDMLTGDASNKLQHPDLPFSLTVDATYSNCSLVPISIPIMAAELDPNLVVDGWGLMRQPNMKDREQDIPGAVVTANFADGTVDRAILWAQHAPGFRTAPWTLPDNTYAVQLRKKAYPMPFMLKLDDFHHTKHPNTRIAASYESNVTVSTADQAYPQLIQMNEPLRREHIIVFQSSYGPPDAADDERLWSGFSIVRNPSDQWPLWSCVIIALGLCWHFGAMLMRYIERQGQQRTAASSAQASVVNGKEVNV